MMSHRPALTLLGAAPADLARSESAGALPRSVAPALSTHVQGEMALLRRIQTADTAALDELLRMYWGPLVAYVARLLARDDGAEDVVQEVFIRLWERRERLAVGSGVQPLLYRIARNIALNERRSERVRARWLWREGTDSARRVPTPLHATILNELELAIDRAIEDLPPRRREAFVLARFHDMTHREIAEVMGVSVQTVANQISGALADLRRHMRPFLEPDHAGPR